MAMLAAVGLGLSSWPIHHEHRIEEGEAHSVHVHAQSQHVHHHGHHHGHHHDGAHSHAHACPESQEQESETSTHLHLLILELDLQDAPSCDLPRPMLSCLGIFQASSIEAAEDLSIRYPGARAPPVGLSNGRHII